MLEQLLKEIRAGGTLEANELAVRLGVSPQMVHAMLEHLERAGYIRPYSSCSDGCQGCSLQAGCKPAHHNEKIKLWQSVRS